MEKKYFPKIQCSDKSYKEMVDDWKHRFPTLSQYTASALFALYDLMLIGLRISRDRFGGNFYNVELVAMQLWNSGIPTHPLLHYSVQGKKGLAIWVRFELHDYDFHKNVKSVKENVGVFLSAEISSSALFTFLDEHYLYPVDRHNPADVIPLYELKMALALYFDDKPVTDAIKKALDIELRFWDRKHFEKVFKKSIEEWKVEFYGRFDNREAFMAHLRENLANPKVAKLKRGHIVWDVSPKDIRVPSRLSLYWWRLQYKWFKYRKCRWMKKQGME